eukprot:6860318-Ditylum_brightwellii.AAC.1
MAWNKASQSTSSSKNPKETVPIKLSPADFPSFAGEIEEQESYKTKAEAQIRQTAFKFLLTWYRMNQDERERDEQLFNIFKNPSMVKRTGLSWNKSNRGQVDKQLLENYLLEIDCRDRTLKVKELTNM